MYLTAVAALIDAAAAAKGLDHTVESALIGAGAALIGVGGTVIVAVTAARNAKRTNQATIDNALKANEATLAVALGAQFADRYSKALDQISSENLETRIGGVYALEGIARYSPAEYLLTVAEFLASFIRRHALTPSDSRPERHPSPEVQTALTVIGRLHFRNDRNPHLDLTGADLTDALWPDYVRPPAGWVNGNDSRLKRAQELPDGTGTPAEA